MVDYVRACTSCQTRKSPKTTPAGLLQCIKVERPFQKIGIDLLGPFTTSHSGNKIIIVVVDYLTKWVELEALPTGKADVVTTFFVNRVVLRHGLPETMISDRGKCFLANLTQSTLHKLGVKHKTTSSYHPQTNGQVERMNHTLAMMISMYVAEDQKDWDEQLPYICFAYNTSRQDTTGFSPFFLLYGREAILPIDVFLGAQPNPWIDVPQANVPYADRLLNDLHEARNLVRIRIQRAQEKQKQIYDAQHHDVSFQKGDVVLVYKPIRKKGRSDKLLHRWIGPYVVIRRTTPVNYEVKLQQGRHKSDIVHVVAMKPFHVRESNDNNLSPLSSAPAVVSCPISPVESSNSDLQRTKQLPLSDSVPTVVPPSVSINHEESFPPPTEPDYINNRGLITTLPPRTRRRPDFFMAGLVYFILIVFGCFLSGPDSAWTVVTDILLSDAELAVGAIEQHLSDLSQVAIKHRKDGVHFEKTDASSAWRDTTSFMAADKIDKRVLLLRRTLLTSKTRLAACALSLLGANRPKRAVFDFGGTALKWLFGISTNAEFLNLNSRIESMETHDRTVVHLLERHASIVNETLQISRGNLVLLQELQNQSIALHNRVDSILDYIKHYELEQIQRTQYFEELDNTFVTLDHILIWLQQQLEAWEIGFDSIGGRPFITANFISVIVATSHKGN